MRKIRILVPESIDIRRRSGAPELSTETKETHEGVLVEVVHRRAPDMPVQMVEGDYEAKESGLGGGGECENGVKSEGGRV